MCEKKGKNGYWIWSEDTISSAPEQVIFYKKLMLVDLPTECVIHICADSRYNFYINGKIVSRGPCRSTSHDRFFDEVDVREYLTLGENILFAEVIHYNADFKDSQNFIAGPASICSTMRGGFLITEKATDIGIATDSMWLCAKNEGYGFRHWGGYLLFTESCDLNHYPKEEDFVPAVTVSVSVSDSPMSEVWMLYPRPIPFVKNEKKENFRVRIVCNEQKTEIGLNGYTVPKNSEAIIEIDPYEYITANWCLSVGKGKSSVIAATYSETISADGSVLEYEQEVVDEYILSGDDMNIAPFYYRAFRTLIFRIKTGDEPLLINGFSVYNTGYPLNITTTLKSSNALVEKIFDVSVRTLKSCMYETYMDCPYYEQMQYLMDTMLQTVYTYQISDDDRLVRKAINDFIASQLPSGLIPCQAPARIRQIIPGFDAYFFLMLTEHYKYHRDADFIREALPSAKRIFYYFNQFVNSDGLISDTGYWQFVDWVKEWDFGRPDLNNKNYIYSMMFSYAYTQMAELLRALGNESEAEEYYSVATSLRDAVNRVAYDEKAGLYTDGPNPVGFSQHGQIWAVLCGAAEGVRAKEIMTRAVTEKHFGEASFCMKFFLFRALEKSGCYELSARYWSDWTAQLDMGATTWAEDNVQMRSKCHAWSCTLLYELVACALGVTPGSIMENEIRIEPKALWLSDFSGSVSTRYGVVSVEWHCDGEQLSISAKLPNNVCAIIALPNGNEIRYDKTEINESFMLG